MKLNKTLALTGLSFIVAVGITFGVLNGIHKNKIEDIKSSHKAQIESINIERAEDKVRFDSVTFELDQQKFEIDSLTKVGARYQWEIDRLNKDLIKAWNIAFDADIDDNYISLHNRYPTTDTLEYPFSGEQVKGIVLDLVRADYKDSIMIKMLANEKNLEKRLLTSTEMVETLYKERDEWQELKDSLYDRLAAKTEELNVSEEEVEALKRKLRIRTAGSVSVIAVAAAAILLIL